MAMVPDSRTAQLRQDLLRVLVEVARTSGMGLTPPQRAQVAAAVWSVVETYLSARPQSKTKVLRTLLKRGHQALYGLGAAGTGVTLSAMFTGSLQPITLAAAFSASIAALLAGLVIELLEGSLEN